MKTQRVFAVLILAVVCACDDGSSQPAARDLAAEASCDRIQACGDVGAGKTYASRDACDVKLRSSWQDLWPPADCDGRIDTAKLDVCLQSIKLAECGNGFDLFNIIANKCAKATVCSLPAGS